MKINDVLILDELVMITNIKHKSVTVSFGEVDLIPLEIFTKDISKKSIKEYKLLFNVDDLFNKIKSELKQITSYSYQEYAGANYSIYELPNYSFKELLKYHIGALNEPMKSFLLGRIK
jgi:hypothetical protein